MRLAPVALVLGAIVLIQEIPFIGSRTGLWLPIVLLASGVVILALSQIRHGQ